MITKSEVPTVYDAPGKKLCREAFTESVIRLYKSKRRLLTGTVLANDIFSDVIPLLPYCKNILVFEKIPSSYNKKLAFLRLNSDVEKKVSLVKADMFNVAAACKFEKGPTLSPDDFAWLDFCLHYCPNTHLITETWLRKKMSSHSVFFATYAKHTMAAFHGESYFSITSNPELIRKDILSWVPGTKAVEARGLPEDNLYKGRGRRMMCFGYELKP